MNYFVNCVCVVSIRLYSVFGGGYFFLENFIVYAYVECSVMFVHMLNALCIKLAYDAGLCDIGWCG